jgi:hypothetical protein
MGDAGQADVCHYCAQAPPQMLKINGYLMGTCHSEPKHSAATSIQKKMVLPFNL